MPKKSILAHIILIAFILIVGCAQNATGKGKAKEESLVEGNYNDTSTDLESKIKNLES